MSQNTSLVRKSNWLITASYKLTLNEQRLVLFAISKIPFDAEGNQRRVVITTEEMLALFPDMGKHVHEQIKEAVDNLGERWIKVSDPNKVDEFRWITSKTTYKTGEAKVAFSFSPEVLPYLQQLKEQFTKYRLGDISNLKSIYSIRLYEMLMQFQNTGIISISVQEFKERLGVTHLYSDYPNLRRKVIEHAIQELEEKSHFSISFKAEKKGKSIDKLIFLFSPK